MALKASAALLVFLALRVLKEREEQEDYQGIPEGHWRAIKARTVNRAHRGHRDRQRSSSSLQAFSHPKATRETQVLLDRVGQREEVAEEETPTVFPVKENKGSLDFLGFGVFKDVLVATDQSDLRVHTETEAIQV